MVLGWGLEGLIGRLEGLHKKSHPQFRNCDLESAGSLLQEPPVPLPEGGGAGGDDSDEDTETGLSEEGAGGRRHTFSGSWPLDVPQLEAIEGFGASHPHSSADATAIVEVSEGGRQVTGGGLMAPDHPCSADLWQHRPAAGKPQILRPGPAHLPVPPPPPPVGGLMWAALAPTGTPAGGGPRLSAAQPRALLHSSSFPPTPVLGPPARTQLQKATFEELQFQQQVGEGGFGQVGAPRRVAVWCGRPSLQLCKILCECVCMRVCEHACEWG